ncbi:MAG: CoA pyrophosphatase [Acidobacteriota bacterium]
MRLADVVKALETRAGDLPGRDAHVRMAPEPRFAWKPGVTPDSARPAAGLILLFPLDGEAAVLLTKRSESMPQHGGQISLPGGAVDPNETIEAAALREAFEEVGLDPADVRLVGRLTPLHISVSGFVLHPVIGVCDPRPHVRVASPEVDRIIEVRLSEFADPARHRRTTRVRDGVEIRIPFFDVGGEQVWGATAMVLAELIALLHVVPGC